MGLVVAAEQFLRASRGDGENAALAAFRSEIRNRHGAIDPVVAFHAVRNLPYRSTGDRSVAGILSRRAGSCTSKHLLLAALLQDVGVPAEVVMAAGDFAAPLQDAVGVPAFVLDAAAGGIPDIHNIVVALIDGRKTMLDATWPDTMKPFRFRVNDDWNGAGNTAIALDVESWLGSARDIPAAKAELINSWPADLQARRRRFL